jgi:hypothetical protein
MNDGKPYENIRKINKNWLSMVGHNHAEFKFVICV